MKITREYAKLTRVSVEFDQRELERFIYDYLAHTDFNLPRKELSWEIDDNGRVWCTATMTVEDPLSADYVNTMDSPT